MYTALRGSRRVLRLQARYGRWNSSISGAYADKLKIKIQEEGVASLDELKTKLKKEGRIIPEKPLGTPTWHKQEAQSSADALSPSAAPKPAPAGTRKDSSPVKPLSEFLNVSALTSKPHTVEQISALWTLYHASRSSGTGRGFVSAAVPLKSYEAMLDRARKWPMFVLPLPRQAETPPPASTEEAQTPMEFHFMQWGFHPPPALPSEDPFLKPQTSPNPPISTLLFTPLIQYKLHQSYAPPYFIITHYTDFAASHGVVLLRGEITPSSSVGVDGASTASDGKFMLSQTDAQLLALGVQKFYLPSDSDTSGEAELILRQFHEQPSDFQWERLLKFGTPGVV